MSRKFKWWARSAAVVAVGVSLFVLSALAQQPGKEQTNDRSQAPELNHAKEMAALIKEGQLNLRDATEIAEKHSKGTALEAKCAAQSAQPGNPNRDVSAKPPEENGDTEGKHLIYEVSCFAGDKLKTIKVDGRTKKVIEAP